MTRKQISIAGGIFILAFVIGALVNIPVIQLLHIITLPKQLAYQGLQGSVTNGKVERIEFQGFSISNLEFQLQPGCLLKIAICYQLSSDEDGVMVNLERSLITQSTQVLDTTIELPASVFDSIPNMLVKPAGDFWVQIERLQLSADQKLTELKALLQWKNAGIQGEKQAIGNYAAEVNNTKDGLSAILSDQNSLLGLKGSVNVNWKGNYDIDLELEHKQGLNPSVISVLEMSAKKSGLNQFRLKQKGVLPANITNQLVRFSPSNS